MAIMTDNSVPSQTTLSPSTSSSSSQSAMSTTSSQSSTSTVRFRSRHSIEEIRRISRLSSYDISEIIAMWGDVDEQVQKKEELKEQLQDLEDGRRCRKRHSDNLTFSTVGLRDKFGPRSDEKQDIREAAYQAVLWEQYYQWEEQQSDKEEEEENMDSSSHQDVVVYNQDALAKVYRDITAEAQSKAHEEAVQLAQELVDMQ